MIELTCDHEFRPKIKTQSGTVGIDFYCPEDVLFESNQDLYIIPSGIHVKNMANYWMWITTKSSSPLNGWRVEAGVIDNDYRGEILIAISLLPAAISGLKSFGSSVIEYAIPDDKDETDFTWVRDTTAFSTAPQVIFPKGFAIAQGVLFQYINPMYSIRVNGDPIEYTTVLRDKNSGFLRG